MGYREKNRPDIESLLKESLQQSKRVRDITDGILDICDVCENLCTVRKLLDEAACVLGDMNKNVRTLYANFNPSDYKCSGESNMGLLRSVVVTDFIKDLFIQLLNTDICKDNESLKFYLDTMRRISFDVDIIVDVMILLNRTYYTDEHSKCPPSDPVNDITSWVPVYDDRVKHLVQRSYEISNSIEVGLNKLYSEDPVGEPSCLFTPRYSQIQDSLCTLKEYLLELEDIFIHECYSSTNLQISRWLIDGRTRIDTTASILYTIVMLKDSCKKPELCTAELNFTSALLSFDMLQADIISINALVNGGI